MKTSPYAGKRVELSMLVDVPKLVTAYYSEIPDPAVPAQRVTFGTSGHRGSPFNTAFNEGHILALTQAVCLYRAEEDIDGPLFLGMDTHALSVPAFTSALEAQTLVTAALAAGSESTFKALPKPHNLTVSEAVDAWRNEGDPN